jgi:hypothetical protein
LSIIICNPERFSKVESWNLGVAHATDWLRENKLRVPRFEVGGPQFVRPGRRPVGRYWMREVKVVVDVPHTVVPCRVPFRSWSFTGYKADLTAAGVCCHEVGHHVNAMLGWRRLQEQIVQEIYDEPEVSGYEPDRSEIISEMFKLFLLNPDLLRVGRPRRFAFATETLGLRPPHMVPWEEVLQWAHPKLRAAARNWIAKASRPTRRGRVIVE